MSTTTEDDTSMSSNANNFDSHVEDYEPDEGWEDCSLCDAGDECQFNVERVTLPGREAVTSDIEAFLNLVSKVKDEPRGIGETPFNEEFWLFIKSKLELAVPIGYTDLDSRYQAAPKGPTDNWALIQKFIAILPVNPIYPNVVAEMSGVPLINVLTELLHATATGMCSLRFTPVCERCGSPTCASSMLVAKAKLPNLAYCRGCRFTSPIDCMEKIKVLFVLNPDILYVLAENLPCKPTEKTLALSEVYAMVPATFSGSGFRYSLGCDGDLMLVPALPAGKYRMNCQISLSDSMFIVERDATEADEPHLVKIHVSDLYYIGGPRKQIVVPHGKLRIEVFCDTKSFFILWIHKNVDDHQFFYVPPEERHANCSALLVMSHPSYKSLFEGTQLEGQHFTSAVAQMAMDPTMNNL